MSFGGGSGSSSIAGSTDVVLSGPANNQVLGYNTSLAKWQNQALSGTYVLQGQMCVDLSKQAGVDNTGAAECAAAITTAFAAATSAGIRIFAKGTYKIATTVTLTSNADLQDATFNYTSGSGVALRVGGASGVNITSQTFSLPKVNNTAKSGNGWTGSSIGIECVNLDACIVNGGHVLNFVTGLRVYGLGAGNAYNTYNLGNLENNKVNLLIDADATGWSNQNLYNGGKLSHYSNEGANIIGARHIAISVCPNSVNNNTFVNPSYEGDTPEFQAAIAGSYNIWINPRWEAATPAVRWDSDSTFNTIMYGSYARDIAQTWVAGSNGSNQIWTRNHMRLASDGGTEVAPLLLENTGSSNNASDIVMAAGAGKAGSAPATQFCVARSASATKMKQDTDAFPRITLDHVTGRVYLGSGSVAPTAYLDATGFHP